MRYALLIALFVFVAIGCDSGVSDNDDLSCVSTPIPGTLQPFELGNFWDYELVNFSGEIVYTLRREVTDQLETTSEDATPIFVISEYRLDDPEDIRRSIWTNTPAGLQQAGYVLDDDTLIVNALTYPYPSDVGIQFESYWFDEDPNTGELLPIPRHEFEVTSASHVTSIPLGDFDTVVFEEKRYSLDDVWVGPYFHQYAPGIGLVAIDGSRLATEGGLRPSPQTRLVDYCLMQ
jgi:hypothetical protein